VQEDLCRDFFRRAVVLELSFFEAAYADRACPQLRAADLGSDLDGQADLALSFSLLCCERR
jgi:hypothetical protein